MYESHFGFKTRPFTATPNTECFFPTEHTRRAFESVVSCIDRASGAALIVGGSGLGKSLLLQVIGSHFQQGYSVAILESASITSRRELLQSILFELGLPYRGMEEGELRLTLMDYLKPSDRCPNGLLLCVDEAHLLQTKLLEELKMITNLVRDGRPRARLVLAGNATIEERLTDPKLESLNQRIATRAYLQPMSQHECRDYVAAHLNHVGRKTLDIFDDDAVEAVHTATNGIPRLVNQVCDHSFILAIAEGKARITKEMINEAWSDIQRLPVQWHVLGSETESKNDHVIEFGSLSGDEDHENDTNSADIQLENTQLENIQLENTHENTQLENTQLENTHEAAPSTDSQAVSNELPSVSTELNIEEEREPERVEFVFTGPENPFNEPFPAEEMVADAFTQVIGHSPLRPNRPLSVAATQTEETAPRTPTPTADQTLDENVNSDITRLDSPGTPTSPDDSSDVPQTMDSNSTSVDSAFEPPTTEQGFNQAVESPAPLTNSEIFPANLETTPVPETASEPSQSTTESIADYLAKSSEAVTFGGGQGIYSNQFPVTEESHSPIPALNQQTAPDVSKENDVVDEISQTVQNIKLEMESISKDSVASLSPDRPESNQNSRTDDRDMIIVEEETKPSQTIQSVPLEDVAVPATAPTAKREDYQKLFDRLRKG